MSKMRYTHIIRFRSHEDIILVNEIEHFGNLACQILDRIIGPTFVELEIAGARVNVRIQTKRGIESISICKPNELKNFVTSGGLEKIGHVQNK